MAKAAKIEERTIEFVKAMEVLISQGIIESQKSLSDKLGLANSTTLTEIKKGRQNIQPEVWEKFKQLYQWPRKTNSDISVNSTKRDEELVSLREAVENLRAVQKLHTKLIKDLMQEAQKIDRPTTDNRYANELERILSQGS